MRTTWIDASSGISGDMLLGALHDFGVPLSVMQRAVDTLSLPESVILEPKKVMRSGLGATKVDVRAGSPHAHRNLTSILSMLTKLDGAVSRLASDVFGALAVAEAAVHRVAVDDVHFHEVGAVDSIADVVGVVAGFHWLGSDEIVCSPIALGAGRTTSAHGSIPVPGPAVLELLARADIPGYGGPLERELATPTGVALALVLAGRFGPMPAMTPNGTGTGAGAWDPPGHANVLRVVSGTRDADAELRDQVVLSANVDDLDPRLLPGVLAELMDAGAADAWITPILMKKGRPAHTISVLVDPGALVDVQRTLVTTSSTIGLRRHEVAKVALPREVVTLEVDGAPVRVKVAWHDGHVVNVSPEYGDVAEGAVRLGVTEKQMLARITHASATLWELDGPTPT